MPTHSAGAPCKFQELRDTELFSRPYVRIVNVFLGIERGYEEYENRQSQPVDSLSRPNSAPGF